MTLLDVRGLSVLLPSASGAAVPVVDEVSFAVHSGSVTGLIGESGSGKTMTAMAVIGLLPEGASCSGELWWAGEDLLAADPARRRRARGREIAMIFQDPLAALNPSQTIGRQVGEILRRDGLPRARVRERVLAALERVGVPDPARRIGQYPHQFSGGLRQRAMIALALAGEPRLLLADEPTTALDVTVQARVLDLLRRLRAETGQAMLFVSHDLRVIAHVADEVVVMYAGRVAERGPVRQVFRAPHHPYTRALVESVPAVRAKSVPAEPLPGAPASPLARPAGCAFHPRCPLARDRCRRERPEVRALAPGRHTACHFAEELAAGARP
ncbi:ABC transporter ATP-binding protein [Microtetraspora sp. NBRC 13810]|uniref:ABC transporter ATP-binding protein n=1 Tax=Microtetraspora sp. NBRC 13810 TaxID=3030990 RepID=UPI0024A1884C|nr:ABC transporter ATP-binding protein [Microtetraspora sp. NBRC 13810]GLW11711.1 ABC transporter ATP-binding protein [Microtetraspora sp. NBRC 13810]